MDLDEFAKKFKKMQTVIKYLKHVIHTVLLYRKEQ
jgi:hypothetical protein